MIEATMSDAEVIAHWKERTRERTYELLQVYKVMRSAIAHLSNGEPEAALSLLEEVMKDG